MGMVPGSIGFTPGENGESENGSSGDFILLFGFYFFKNPEIAPYETVWLETLSIPFIS